MKTFIKFIAFFLISLSFFSNTFAYELSISEKTRLDIITQRIENYISVKGELYRPVYISKLKEIRNNLTDAKLIAYVNYVLESLDILNIFGNIDLNYQSCSSNTRYINGHTYNVPSMNNGTNSTISVTNGITNGYIIYRQTFSCNNGIVNLVGTEEKVSTNCSSGYTVSGDFCISSYNLNRSCDATNKLVNGHTYYLSSISSGYTITQTTNYNNGNGYFTYKQSFYCSNGVYSTVGIEEYLSSSCNSNYYMNGSNCYYYNYNNNNQNYNNQNCEGTYRTYNGVSSYVDFLYHGNTRKVLFSLASGNHYITYRCNNGSLIEDSYYSNCANGYVWNGNSCVYNNSSTNNNVCYAHTETVNGHVYNVPAQNYGNVVEVLHTCNTNGVYQYKQNFYCDNGTTTAVWGELIKSCMSGYYLNNGYCTY